MARKRDESVPSLDEDRRALYGLWRWTGLSTEGRQVVLCIWAEGITLSAFDERNLFCYDYTLEEGDGDRLLFPKYHENRTVYFRYRLDGDRLEFSPSPAAAEIEEGKNLEGVWQRLR